MRNILKFFVVMTALCIPFFGDAQGAEPASTKPTFLPEAYINRSTEEPIGSPPAPAPDVKKVADVEVGKSCFVTWRDKASDGIGIDENWKAWLNTRSSGFSQRPRAQVGVEILKVTRTSVRKVLVDIGETSAAWANDYTDKNLLRASWKGPPEEDIGTDVFEVEFTVASKPGRIFNTVPEGRRGRRSWSLKPGDEAWMSLGRIHCDVDGVGWIDGNCLFRNDAFTDSYGPAVKIGIGGDSGNCAWVDLSDVTYKWRPDVRPPNLNAPKKDIEPGAGARFRHLLVWYWKLPPATTAAGRTATDVRAK